MAVSESKVAIVSRHPVCRAALAALLSEELGEGVVMEASSLGDLPEQPDLPLLIVDPASSSELADLLAEAALVPAERRLLMAPERDLGLARRVTGLMPGPQGVMAWPAGMANHSVLCDETAWPLETGTYNESDGRFSFLIGHPWILRNGLRVAAFSLMLPSVCVCARGYYALLYNPVAAALHHHFYSDSISLEFAV